MQNKKRELNELMVLYFQLIENFFFLNKTSLDFMYRQGWAYVGFLDGIEILKTDWEKKFVGDINWFYFIIHSFIIY